MKFIWQCIDQTIGMVKTILYVHGGPGSHSKDFEDGLYDFKEFRETEYAYITYDQRGSGRSEISKQNLTPLSHKNNIEDLVILIANAAQIFNLEKIDLLYGHSYGDKTCFMIHYGLIQK